MCDSHIVTDHVSENTRIRFLHGCKFNVEYAMEILLGSERWRYKNQMDTMNVREFYENYHRSNCIVGHDPDGRPLVYSRCRDWRLGDFPSVNHSKIIVLLTDYLFSTMPPTCDSYIWLFDLEGFGYEHLYIEPMKEVINTI